MKPPGPIIIVFGITGDLSRRKLLPALYHLLRQDLLAADTRIVGLSRRPLSTEQLLNTVELCVLEKDKVCDPAGIEKVQAALSTLQLDPNDAAGYPALARYLNELDPNNERLRLFYLSVPGAAYRAIVQNLGGCGLNQPNDRLLIEKPFGHDFDSARELLNLTASTFKEEQLYRIDHYLAKETAQNLLAFRMHNPIFSPLWNAEHVARVHVRAIEKIGIEGRAGFYEQTGALRDLVQSHLLQLLALTLMDVPADMSSQAIHASKQYFLAQLQPASPSHAVRGQYEDYREEAGNPKSTVETYARLRLEHASERWEGTDIVLETGKGLHEKRTDITIEFKQPHEARRNNLIFHLQPDEGISLDLIVKQPGFTSHMHHAALKFRYADTYPEADHIDAYERVLMDALRGDQSLFASDEEVLTTWRILQPLLGAWHENDQGLLTYPLGAQAPL